MARERQCDLWSHGTIPSAHPRNTEVKSTDIGLKDDATFFERFSEEFVDTLARPAKNRPVPRATTAKMTTSRRARIGPT